MNEFSQFASYPSLAGRVTFITGGASGIGAELVRQFARQRSRVAFIDIDDIAAKRLVETAAAEGSPGPYYIPCDVRDIEALQAAIEVAGRELGPVTVLINNAANDERHPFETVSVIDWDDRQNVNLRPHFFAIQSVAPMMRAAGGGSVINLGSITWHAGFGGLVGYSTAKAAVEGLTRAMARELGSDRIRVNCLIPGWTMTERQLGRWLTPDSDRDRERAQCLKDRLVPADVARLALWLAADDSRMCTNQNYIVDGGWI